MPDIREPDFLVVGLQKCGTFWVTALLDAHPEISCIPSFFGGRDGVKEVHLFDTLASIDEDGGERFRRVFGHKHEGFFADLVPLADTVERKELYALFRDRYSRWCDRFRKKRLVGEKTTEYIFHLDLVDSFFPSIRKLCILRNPKDRIVSFHFHQLRKGQKTEKTVTEGFITDYLNRVIREYECMLAYRGSLHCITYEGLSSLPEETLRGMLNYLGSSASASIISAMIESASFERLSAKDGLSSRKKTSALAAAAAVSRAILPSRTADAFSRQIEKKYGRKGGEEAADSHYRKGVTGDWKNHLTKEQAKRIDTTVEKREQEVFAQYRLQEYERR